MKYDLQERNIHIWIEENEIKNEQGIKLDFHDHPFLWDIYKDFSPLQVIFKAAQIGFSTLAVIKSFFMLKFLRADIIYTLPTQSDRDEFVSGKVNRIVAQNPILQEYTADKDSVEQKKVGENLIYYRGTWTQKAAIMIPSDINIYDETDASKPDVIEQYSTRLQHSKMKWEWYFSHPSSQGTGVDRHWHKSDQKHWFITCGACKKEQYMEWPKSFDMKKEIYICKMRGCHAEITDDMRRHGRWVAKFKNREFSGYWIPLFLSPRVSAKEIIKYHREKTAEYFYNKVLGLPYVGGGNKLTEAHFTQNITQENLYPADPQNERVILGGDTGVQLYGVIGGEKGLFHYGISKNYDEWDDYMRRWKRMIAVVDAKGDLIGSRAFQERWPGRVFLCDFGTDRNTKQLVRWGKGEEMGHVNADRDRMISLVVQEFTDRRIPIMTTKETPLEQKEEWYDYWMHWNNLTRIKIFDEKTGMFKGYKWVKTGQSDFSFATVYWRVGMSRFGKKGTIIQPDTGGIQAQRGVEILPNMEVRGRHPESIWDMQAQSEDDWRNNA